MLKDFVATYCVETGGDESGSWDFSAGIVHFGEGVADFGDSVKPKRYFEVILGRHPLLTPNFSRRFILYVSLPEVIGITANVIITHLNTAS